MKAQLASYMVSYSLATEKKKHTTAEKLILPAVIDIINTIIDEKAAEKFKCIPLNDNTVSRSIIETSSNREDQLLSRLKTAGDFSIQLDESADISNCAALLVCLRSVWRKQCVENLLLFVYFYWDDG